MSSGHQPEGEGGYIQYVPHRHALPRLLAEAQSEISRQSEEITSLKRELRIAELRLERSQIALDISFIDADESATGEDRTDDRIANDKRDREIQEELRELSTLQLNNKKDEQPTGITEG